MSYSIQCVHCKAILKSPTPIPANKKVRCPACKQGFVTPGDAAPLPASSPPKGEGGRVASASKSSKQPPAPDMMQSIFSDDMGAAIAKLEAEHGKKSPTQEPERAPAKEMPAGLNISIFTGDADAAIANLVAEGKDGKSEPSLTLPEVDDDLVLPDEDESPPTGKKK